MGQFFVVASGIGLVAVLVALLYWLRPLAQQMQQNAAARGPQAQHEAELLRNQILLEAKEEAFKMRELAEIEARDKLAALGRTEDRLCAKDEALEQRRTHLEEREQNLAKEIRQL